MASLDEKGHEVLDQTPVDIPFRVDRPEPIHLRLRRIAEQIYHERQHAGEDVESVDEANDFEVEDDPSCYEPYPEPDLEPQLPDLSESARLNAPLSPEERQAAYELIMNMRKQGSSQQENAGGQSGDCAAPAPAEPAS